MCLCRPAIGICLLSSGTIRKRRSASHWNIPTNKLPPTPSRSIRCCVPPKWSRLSKTRRLSWGINRPSWSKILKARCAMPTPTTWHSIRANVCASHASAITTNICLSIVPRPIRSSCGMTTTIPSHRLKRTVPPITILWCRRLANVEWATLPCR